MPVQKVIYLLACLHYVQGPETLVSGLLYCPWDKAESQIIKVETMEWRAKCKTCRFARWAGTSKQNAETFAIGHMSRNTGHIAYREYVENPASKATKEKFEAYHHGSIHRS